MCDHLVVFQLWRGWKALPHPSELMPLQAERISATKGLAIRQQRLGGSHDSHSWRYRPGKPNPNQLASEQLD
jgi:hypothetical protein